MLLATPTWPAAASTRAPAAVDGPPGSATVLAAFPTALYLGLTNGGELLPVVTTDGLRLPTALTIAGPSTALGWGVDPGQTVRVGRGRVELPSATLLVVRRWRPARVPVGSGVVSAWVTGAGQVATGESLRWCEPARVLTRMVVGDPGDGAALDRAVSGLVGAGVGLTPSGDDVLTGVLLGLRLQGCADGVRRLWRAIAPRLDRTTSLSAALLTQARDGYAVDPVVRLAKALVSGSRPEVERAVAKVLQVGHTSGADLLGGLAGCLQSLEGAHR